MEIWKDIQGYEGLYQVSNLGKVKSVEKDIVRIRNGKRDLQLIYQKRYYFNGKTRKDI